MKKLWIILLLGGMLLIGFGVNVSAEEILPYASEVITDTGVGINKSDGKVYATATVRATGTATKLGFTTITLYHKVDGVWKVAASASENYAYNQRSYGVSISCTWVSGREYKATCSSKVTCDGVTDTGSAAVGPVKL